MKIWREIDGRKYAFELSEGELLNAYEEQRHKYVIENVKMERPDYPEGLASDIALEIMHQQDVHRCAFDVALHNVLPGFKKDLIEDKVEHTNLEAMLENSEYASRMEKRNMELNKLALEKYWGEYLTNPEKQL